MDRTLREMEVRVLAGMEVTPLPEHVERPGYSNPRKSAAKRASESEREAAAVGAGMERLASEERPHQSGGEAVAPAKRSGRRGGLPGVLLASGAACRLTAVMASAPSIKTNKFDGAIAEANERSETENGEAQKCVLTLSTGERRDYTALVRALEQQFG
ncbi:UNVERIFIED_CONTAM: hypothetical protein FKN15_031377 [Acipenser sinensis]